MALTRLKLFRGEAMNRLVESFSGFADLQGGGGGTPTGIAGVIHADAPTVVPGDGGAHALDTAIAAPPDWYDGVSLITASGLYAVSARVFVDTPPTTLGLLASIIWGTPDPTGTGLIPVDFLGIGAFLVSVGVFSLADEDLPTTWSMAAKLPTDVTLALGVQAYLAKLL